MDHKKIIRRLLKILATAAFGLYILFLMDEGVPLQNNSGFADSSVYYLFLLFVIAYLVLWINEVISGIIFIVWHGLQWLLVFYVWIDGELTLILGLPIGVLGIAILLSGLFSAKQKSRDPNQSHDNGKNTH